MEISIYHISDGNLVSAVVRLLEKAYLAGKRCVFHCPIEERASIVDKALWTYSTGAFIPHGDSSLGFCDQQPIYFSRVPENPNNATVLLLMDSFDLAPWDSKIEKIMLAFEDISQLKVVTDLHERLKTIGENVHYWKQSTKGWEMVA
jgi:DNA polymerase-3 subunit chi